MSEDSEFLKRERMGEGWDESFGVVRVGEMV